MQRIPHIWDVVAADSPPLKMLGTCHIHLPALISTCCLQVTHDISHLSAADVFRAPGVQTPLITRFSTVIHERGSPETLRDPRGFAVSPFLLTRRVCCGSLPLHVLLVQFPLTCLPIETAHW